MLRITYVFPKKCTDDIYVLFYYSKMKCRGRSVYGIRGNIEQCIVEACHWEDGWNGITVTQTLIEGIVYGKNIYSVVLDSDLIAVCDMNNMEVSNVNLLTYYKVNLQNFCNTSHTATWIDINTAAPPHSQPHHKSRTTKSKTNWNGIEEWWGIDNSVTVICLLIAIRETILCHGPFTLELSQIHLCKNKCNPGIPSSFYYFLFSFSSRLWFEPSGYESSSEMENWKSRRGRGIWMSYGYGSNEIGIGRRYTKRKKVKVGWNGKYERNRNIFIFFFFSFFSPCNAVMLILCLTNIHK